MVTERRSAILLGIDVGKELGQTKEDHSPCFDTCQRRLENVLVDEQFSETFGPYVESSIEIVGRERTREILAVRWHVQTVAWSDGCCGRVGDRKSVV